MSSQWNHPIVQEDLNQVVASILPWNSLANKRILVSGANGFLPAFLVMSLIKANDTHHLNLEVTALCRNYEKAQTRFGDLIKRKDLNVFLADVTQGPFPEGPWDFVIHAASQASPKYYGVDPVGTLRANTDGTRLLLDQTTESTRFLYFSSSEVYGHVSPENIPTPEDVFGSLNPALVRACYAESKRLGETLCVSYKHQYHRKVVMVRPFHTYGPGMDLEDGRVFADFVKDALNGQAIQMKSDGLAQRAFCYLADATAGFLTILMTGENGQAYNVGNPNAEVSILNLAKVIAELAPGGKIPVIEVERNTDSYLPSAVQRNAPDISKIKDLGWMPNTDIREGFRRTIQFFL